MTDNPLSYSNILLAIIALFLACLLSITIYRALKKKKAETANKYNPNGLSVIRDVLTASLSNGQFPLALIALIIILGMILMGGDKVYLLLIQTVNIFKTLAALGWIMFVLTIFISAMAIRWTKTGFKKQSKAIEDERQLFEDKYRSLKAEYDILVREGGIKKQLKR